MQTQKKKTLMSDKVKSKETATSKPELEKPQVFTADIYLDKRLISSISLKAANRTAAIFAINKMINVKVK